MLVPAFFLLATALANVQGQTPTEQKDPMKDLAVLLGNWESHEVNKGPDGKEMPFTLKGKNTMILEGTALQVDEGFEVQGRKLANHILMNYDPKQKKYRAYWFTNGRPTPLIFSGVLTEKQFVLTGDVEPIRITYNFLEAGHYKAEVALKVDDKWDTRTVAEYRRTGS